MIEGLQRFLEIDDETKTHGRELWKVLAPRADGVIGKFYRRVQEEAINSHVTDAAIERLKVQQKRHWAELFNSQLGEADAARARRVSMRHREIDLNPMWLAAGYMMLKIEFTNVIVEADLPTATKGRLIKVLDKYIAFDLALALSTYGAVVVD